ncbi:ATPase subunit 4, mitochondrial [Tanacetum coccineum]
MMGQSFASLVPTVAAAESAIGLAIFVITFRIRGTTAVESINIIQAHPILKSFPKPLSVQLLKDREKAFEMRLSSTNMQARKMLFTTILSICASSSKKISIYNEEMIGRDEKKRLDHLKQDLMDVVFDGAFGGVGDEEVVIGEGVVVISSSLDMLTNSCLGGIMVSLIFLEGLDEEAFVEFMVEWCEKDEDDDRREFMI